MATAHDAELILKLYDLRREPVMREARNFMLTTFWPETVDEFLAVQRDFGEQNNAYLRQFVGYWEMAAAMVLRGALDADLFFDSNNEPFFVFAKMQHLRQDAAIRTQREPLEGADQSALPPEPPDGPGPDW